jgi:hypothetical protein
VRKTLITLALVPFLLVVPSLRAQGVWGSRGISHRFVAGGSRLYAAEGRGVAVYDLTTNTRLESATRDDETTDVALLGSSEVVSLTSAGIDRWTIQPDGRLTLTATVAQRGLTHLAATPSLVAATNANGIQFYTTANGTLAPGGMLPVSGDVTAIAFHGDHLIMAIDKVGVEIVDPGDPASAIYVTEPARELAVSGDMLYLACGGNGLSIVSLAGTPQVVGRAEGSGQTNLTRIAASGTRVYGVEYDHVVHVYDASDPAAVVALATLDEPATAIAANSTSLYTAGLRVDENGLPVDAGLPLRVFDVTAAGTPRAVAQVNEPAGPVTGIAISPNGSIAYAVDRPYLRVLDISQSAAPKQIAALQIDDIQDHLRINADGSRVVLYNRGLVQLVDVTNPYAPRLIAVWDSSGRPPSRADFLGSYILEANWITGFHVLDFDHYTPPGIIGSMKMDYHELAIKPGSQTVYLSAERSALISVDLRDPSKPFNPNAVYLWMQEGAFADANARHGDLLLVHTPEGVHILDLTDPLAPAKVGLVAMPDAVSIAASGETLYVAADGRVTPVDLTDATQPLSGDSTMRATAPQQMATVGGKVVIADTYGVRVFGPNTAAVPPPRPVHPRAVRP